MESGITIADPSVDADELLHNPPASGPAYFKVPSALLRASNARTAKVKALADDRGGSTTNGSILEQQQPGPALVVQGHDPLLLAPPPLSSKAMPATSGRPTRSAPASRRPSGIAPPSSSPYQSMSRRPAATVNSAVAAAAPPKAASTLKVMKKVHSSTLSSSSSSSSVSYPSQPQVQQTATAAAAAAAKSTLAEIERIKLARQQRRERIESVREARSGKDAVDLANAEYSEQIAQFRAVWMQWVEKWKGRVTSAELGALDAPIQVCVRKRPMSKLEVQKKALDVLTMSTAVYPNASVYVHEPKVGLDQSHNVATQHFAFDKIFDEQAGNDFIYQSTLASAIPRLLEGENVSLFAYGATGSGKTHTVFGPDGGRSDGKTPADIGLYEYACAAVFDMIRDRPVDAFVSFLEIYSGRVYDLLNRRQPVTLLEQNGNFYFQGLQEYPAQSVADAQALMARGRLSRRTGSTEMNQTSSRSHAIFRIELRPKPDNDPATATDPKPTPSMLTLIDLAGSERGVDTPNSNSVLRREGAAINQSLLALKECIRALHVRAAYVPYRSAKLTCVLRECFTGQSRCFMVLNVAPASSAVEQTLGSLHYANRVKEYGHGGAVVGGGRDVRPEELLARLAAMSPVSSPDRGGAAFADDYTASFASDANGGHETDPISFVDEDGTGHGRDDGEEEVGGPADTSIVVDTSDDDDDAGPECEYADGYDYANAGLSLMSSTSFRSDNDDYENDETPAASRLTLDASGDTRSLPPLSDGSQQYSRLQMAGMRGAGVVQMSDLLDLHRSTLAAVASMSSESTHLLHDASRGAVSTDVYLSAIDLLVDEQVRRLLQVKAMAQLARLQWTPDSSGDPDGGDYEEVVSEMVRQMRLAK